MPETGYLILESGECFAGRWLGGEEKGGEVVFNTSHTGYEEMASDPSYFSQILITTAPMQGNYGIDNDFWESSRFWIHGFICLEMQKSLRESSWLESLKKHGIPVMDQVDTRRLVLHLRDRGTTWGALFHISGENKTDLLKRAREVIGRAQQIDSDWVHYVSCQESVELMGNKTQGPRVAVLDYGCKTNILRELQRRCSRVKVFPARSSSREILDWEPDGILLSNGPGDPARVRDSIETVRELLGLKFIFGICMGNQILGMALGAKTYRLKFGHRGSNHPVHDKILNKIYMTSQNHGYALDPKTLPKGVNVTHINLNDNTISGIQSEEKKCFSVQFHPESHPGPHEAENLFDYFIKQIV